MNRKILMVVVIVVVIVLLIVLTSRKASAADIEDDSLLENMVIGNFVKAVKKAVDEDYPDSKMPMLKKMLRKKSRATLSTMNNELLTILGESKANAEKSLEKFLLTYLT
jgi:hypothetical protein